MTCIEYENRVSRLNSIIGGEGVYFLKDCSARGIRIPKITNLRGWDAQVFL